MALTSKHLDYLRDLAQGKEAKSVLDPIEKEWPALLLSVLEQIQHIAKYEYPTPRLPPNQAKPRALSPPLRISPSSPTNAIRDGDTGEPEIPNTEESDREKGVKGLSIQASSQEEEEAKEEETTAKAPAPPTPKLTKAALATVPSNETLPGPVQDMLDEICRTLSEFQDAPPHTIQRLAELVIAPKTQYQNVIPFLHALDRVVHVTLSATVFPLPSDVYKPFINLTNINVDPLNGITATAAELGTDESLGGALLTPIPWNIDGPRFDDSQDDLSTDEFRPFDVSSPATANTEVSDPDLLPEIEPLDQQRQESDAATRSDPDLSTNNATDPDINIGDSEEEPHARGPGEIGVADIGPQPPETEQAVNVLKTEQGETWSKSASNEEFIESEDITMGSPDEKQTTQDTKAETTTEAKADTKTDADGDEDML